MTALSPIHRCDSSYSYSQVWQPLLLFTGMTALSPIHRYDSSYSHSQVWQLLLLFTGATALTPIHVWSHVHGEARWVIAAPLHVVSHHQWLLQPLRAATRRGHWLDRTQPKVSVPCCNSVNVATAGLTSGRGRVKGLFWFFWAKTCADSVPSLPLWERRALRSLCMVNILCPSLDKGWLKGSWYTDDA